MMYILAQIFSEWVCGFLVCTVCAGYLSVCVADRHAGQQCIPTSLSHSSSMVALHSIV